MAVFKFYNIQALPGSGQANIGESGYRKIFNSLKKQTDSAVLKKEINDIARPLLNDFFFSPFKIKIDLNVAHGEFIKYDVVEKVFDTIDEQESYKSSGGESSKKYRYRFVFDYKLHILAIEKSKGLPSSGPLIKVLNSLLRPLIEKQYPGFNLTITELTNANSLQEVINEATTYKSLHVDLTFSNSEDWIDGLSEELAAQYEKEMRENKIDTIVHIEKASQNRNMIQPTKVAATLLNLACKYGNAAITYINKSGKRIVYKMKDYPIKEKVTETFYDKKKRKNVQKTESEILSDIKSAIITANKLSINATSVKKTIENRVKK